MVTSTIFKTHLLEVGLTQNWESMALWMLTTIGLFYFIMREDPLNRNSFDIAFGRGLGHIRLHTTLEGPWPHYMISEVSWKTAFGHFPFGLSQFHGHGSWLVCEVALRYICKLGVQYTSGFGLNVSVANLDKWIASDFAWACSLIVHPRQKAAGILKLR
jgi:hypothetical protein